MVVVGGSDVCCGEGIVGGRCGGWRVCVGGCVGGSGLSMVAVDVWGVVAVAVVVVVVVGSGGVLFVFLVLFLSGVWSSDMAMDSLISSSSSLHASADAASVVRSCADNWSTVSFVGVVDGGIEEMAMASLISSSVSLHASADAVSVARSCVEYRV